MTLALPRLLALLLALRFPDGKRPGQPREPKQLDLCLLPPYLRRDIGFDTFRCETRRDWRTFR